MSAEPTPPNLATLAEMLGWYPCGEGEVFMFYLDEGGRWNLQSQYVGPPPEWAMEEWMRRPEGHRTGPFRRLRNVTFDLEVIDEVRRPAALRLAADWIAEHCGSPARADGPARAIPAERTTPC